MVLPPIDIFTPASRNKHILHIGKSECEIGVDIPLEQLGLICDYGMQVVDELVVVDWKEMLDFYGQKMKVVRQIGDMAETSGVHVVINECTEIIGL